MLGKGALVFHKHLYFIKHCCKEQAGDLKMNMYSCLGIA